MSPCDRERGFVEPGIAWPITREEMIFREFIFWPQPSMIEYCRTVDNWVVGGFRRGVFAVVRWMVRCMVADEELVSFQAPSEKTNYRTDFLTDHMA